MNITYLLGHLEEARQDLLSVSYTAERYENKNLAQAVHIILDEVEFLKDRLKAGVYGGTVPA